MDTRCRTREENLIVDLRKASIIKESEEELEERFVVDLHSISRHVRDHVAHQRSQAAEHLQEEEPE